MEERIFSNQKVKDLFNLLTYNTDKSIVEVSKDTLQNFLEKAYEIGVDQGIVDTINSGESDAYDETKNEI